MTKLTVNKEGKAIRQVAHRGGAGLWPENTLEAFARAIDMGAEGIELDVHLSADGLPVVHHDESLKPAIARDASGQWLTRPTPLIKDLSFKALQAYDIGRLKPGSGYGARYPEQSAIDGARIPLLGDVLTLVKAEADPSFQLYVELKTALLDLTQSASPEALAETVVALVREKEMSRQVTFVSFDWRALIHAKRLAPEIENAWTTLPFFQIDPDDASGHRFPEGSEDALLREASAKGADWMGGYDWRHEEGATFAARMIAAMGRGKREGMCDGWFAWHGDVTPENAALARAAGLSISSWTVDDENEMRRLAALGIDAILTDRPDRLARVLGG